jgi:hypothetical protein
MREILQAELLRPNVVTICGDLVQVQKNIGWHLKSFGNFINLPEEVFVNFNSDQ